MDSRIENTIVAVIEKFTSIKYTHTHTKSITNILVVSYCAIGDYIMLTPFFRNLRHNYSNANITFVCSNRIYNLVEYMPYVDAILVPSFLENVKHRFEKNLKIAYDFAKNNLGNKYYDLVICPRFIATINDKLIMSFANTKTRIFYDKQGNDCYLRYFDKNINLIKTKTDLERGLEILRCLNCNIDSNRIELWTDEDDRKYALNLLKYHNISDEKIKLAVFLSTSAKYKDWGADRFADVCNILSKEYQIEIILLGAKSDTEEYGKEFCSKVNDVYNLIGDTTIRQTTEVLKLCDIFIGGDTGSMHIADVVNLPGVVISKDFVGVLTWGGSGVDRFLPVQTEITILRPQNPIEGCENGCIIAHHCIRQITSEMAVHAMKSLIQKYCLGKL